MQACLALLFSLWMSAGFSSAWATDVQPVCGSGHTGSASENCGRDAGTASSPASRAEQEGWLMKVVHIAQRPISGATEHHVAGWASWHGRAMVLAWGFLLPAGVLVARFFKVMPGQDWPARLDNKTWWHWHRILQYGGVLVMTAGLAIALVGTAGKSPWRNPHTVLGWAIVVLGWMQIAGGHLRGSKGGPTGGPGGSPLSKPQWAGDHYDMTRRRIVFERLHKGLGYSLLLVSAATIFLGMAIADAPLWMWAGLIAWIVLYIAAFIWWQRRGRCIDTYQAIWGPGKEHPGNRIAPIGWGIRRYTAKSYRKRLMKDAHR